MLATITDETPETLQRVDTRFPRNVYKATNFTYKQDENLLFRPEQELAIQTILSKWNDGHRIVAAAAPVGSGKTLIGAAAAQIYVNGQTHPSDWQIVTLVATKTLQDQVVDELPHITDLRGRANYTCVRYQNKNCSEAMHYCGLGPQCKASEISYYARKQNSLVTNYSLWFEFAKRLGGWRVPTVQTPDGKVPVKTKFLVIMDEAHSIEDELTSALKIKLSLDDIIEVFGKDSALKLTKDLNWYKQLTSKSTRELDWNADQLKPWVDWAKQTLELINVKIEELTKRIESGVAQHTLLSKTLRLQDALQMLSFVNPYEWVVQGSTEKEALEIDCAVLKNKVSYLLFQTASRVLMMSASLNPFVLNTLGIRTQ